MPNYSLELGATRLDAKRLTQLWKAMAALGQRYSTVNVLNSPRPLDPKKPLAQVIALATKRGGWRSVDVGGASFDEHLHLTDTSSYANLANVTASTAQLLRWFVSVVELARFPTASLHLRPNDLRWSAMMPYLFPAPAWLMALGGRAAERLEVKALAALGTVAGLEGLFAKKTKTGVLVGLARAPEEVTAQRVSRFEAEVRRLAGAAEAKALGYDFGALVDATLGATLRALGLTFVVGPDPLELQFRGGPRGLRLSIDSAGESGVEARLESWANVSPTWPASGFGPSCSWPAKGSVLEKRRPVKQRDVEAYLRDLAPRLEKKGAAFFAKCGI